ncbi:MAG: hypothetical protein AB1585_12425 [Thermodesulfobacteriota bacterium]
MYRAIKCFFIILLLFVFSACASKTVDLLNSRIGQMNFEEAIQRFGPPTRCAEEGATKACIWVYGTVSYLYAPVGRHFVPIPTEPPSVRLTFVNGVLASWELRGGWE